MVDFNLTSVEDDEKWDQFVDLSPQGTIFSYSDYLAKAGCKFLRQYICRGTEKVAGLVLALSDDGSRLHRMNIVRIEEDASLFQVGSFVKD